MKKEKIKGVIEATLFASGRVVSLKELELSLELDQKMIIDVINEMQEEQKVAERGIEIIKVNNGYTLASKKDYHEYIYNVIDKRVKPNLSQAALEVLAIIAYNPKITRVEIDNIRGVESNAALYRLLEYNLIEDAGKLDLPGRPVAYKVTEEFLKKFGLNTEEDLPDLPKYKMDENRQIVIDDILEEQGKTEQEEGENIDK
ncbi:MAG: SMC-Scp complex subunit ScpB [Clostridia bacterium]|nr:SMC-Scp complex subunit ScpB [Clostridia bacterium]